MRCFSWLLTVLLILLALTGCTVSTVPVGENGLRVRAGEWLGKNDKGSAMLAFNIVDAGDAGGNVVLLTYAYPCGDGSVSVSSFNLSDMDSPRPIQKTAIHDGAFRLEVEQSGLTGTGVFTKLIFTGKFIDDTFAEGTWEVFGHQLYPGERVCQAANGTWQGHPK
jgi:hypothetical protein